MSRHGASFGFSGLGSELELLCGFTASMALHRTAFTLHLAFDKWGNIPKDKILTAMEADSREVCLVWLRGLGWREWIDGFRTGFGSH